MRALASLIVHTAFDAPSNTSVPDEGHLCLQRQVKQGPGEAVEGRLRLW